LNFASISRKRSADRMIPSMSTTPTRPPSAKDDGPPRRGANTRATEPTRTRRNANAPAATIQATVERFTIRSGYS
jgi:hypothetical protein